MRCVPNQAAAICNARAKNAQSTCKKKSAMTHPVAQPRRYADTIPAQPTEQNSAKWKIANPAPAEVLGDARFTMAFPPVFFWGQGFVRLPASELPAFVRFMGVDLGVNFQPVGLAGELGATTV